MGNLIGNRKLKQVLLSERAGRDWKTCVYLSMGTEKGCKIFSNVIIENLDIIIHGPEVLPKGPEKIWR